MFGAPTPPRMVWSRFAMPSLKATPVVNPLLLAVLSDWPVNCECVVYISGALRSWGLCIHGTGPIRNQCIQHDNWQWTSLLG